MGEIAKGRYRYREVLPFTAMVTVEVAYVSVSTLFKAAASKGMSYCVFIVYSFAISTLVVLPLAFIFHRKNDLPPFSISLLGRICLLGLLGSSAQILGYKGIDYSNPTLSSAISNLVPAFTFALAIIFRMEKVSLTSTSSQAKLVGTIVSISGALIVILYTGPALINSLSPSAALHHLVLIVSSPKSNQWVLGGLLLAADYLLLSVWYILQAQTVRKYPAEFVLVFLYNLSVTIISAPICLMIEPNLNKWKLRADTSLIAILYAGVVGSSFGTVVHTWGLRLKGPVYVVLFKPFSIVIAAVMGVMFLGDTLYLGSVLGAIVISVGFYVVMWGKAKEDIFEDSGVGSLEAPPLENVPLLQ